MRPYRNVKIASLIEEELSKILAHDFFVEGALVTVTGVEVSKDLLHAKVGLGIIPKAKEAEAFLALRKLLPKLQHQLLKKLNIKPMPHLRLDIDRET